MFDILKSLFLGLSLVILCFYKAMANVLINNFVLQKKSVDTKINKNIFIIKSVII